MPKNPLVGTPIVDTKRIHDLVLWEIEKRYCREAVDLPAGTYVIGSLVANETPSALSSRGASPSFSDVLCLANIEVPDGETREVPVLARGPALINLDEVERLEDETDAELITRLADLLAQGVRFVRQPGVVSTPDLSA